jgi:excisionase family DNA binding protein
MALTQDELLTRNQLAEIFKVTPQTVVRWEHAGMFPALHLGSRVRYRRQDVEAFVTRAQRSRPTLVFTKPMGTAGGV